MALIQRKSVQDFLSAIRQQSNAIHTFSAVLNSDGSVQISSTPAGGGIPTVLYQKIWWNLDSPYRRSAATDSNQSSCDSVIIGNADGTNAGASTADAQTFLNTLV